MKHRERELAAVASIVCGGLVAAALGGAAWAGKVGVVLVGVVAALLVGSALVERGCRRPSHQPESVEPTRAPPEQLAHDADIVAQIIGLIGPLDVSWLRAETFEMPWREARIVPFRRLDEEGVFLPYNSDLDLAVRTLVERTTNLLEYYDVHTFPEVLVRAPEWRDMGSNPNGEITADERAALDELRREIRALAVDVADAFDDFAIAAERVTGRRRPP
jgi:hypothetical protein